MRYLRLISTILFTFLVSGTGFLFADCPEGSRPTTASEQQHYLANLESLTARLPNAPGGWTLQVSRSVPGAPSSVCKGSNPTAVVEAVYLSVLARKQIDERNHEYEARIEAMRKLSPEEQKEADALYQQGKELGYKAIAELKSKNQAESDRLRSQANAAYAASKAIQQTHLEKVSAQMLALEQQQQAATASPEVKVRLLAHDLALDQKTVTKKPVEIDGLSKAYYTADNTLNVALGSAADGQPLWVQLRGDQKQVETVAQWFARTSTGENVATR